MLKNAWICLKKHLSLEWGTIIPHCRFTPFVEMGEHATTYDLTDGPFPAVLMRHYLHVAYVLVLYGMNMINTFCL